MNGPMHLFVFGAGYTARAFAGTVAEHAASLGGTIRDAESAPRLRAQGITPFLFDGAKASEDVAAAVRRATHVLVSIPPGAADPVLAACRDLLVAAPELQWIGYLSTVGVYGNYGGAWVSERTTPHPASDRARQRLVAEKAWRSLAAGRGVPLAIVRLAGIYGPGRNAFLNLAEGKAHRVVKPGQVFNRMHVADISTALVAASERCAGGIFNFADDYPAPPQDVVAYAAELSGMPPPPEVPIETAALSPLARSFYADNKRVTNQRIKSDLGVAPRYPTYREGLRALWDDGNWRGGP
jgi:nucleoside-diphosphate-sugar epimerase